MDFGISMSMLNPSIEEAILSNANWHAIFPFKKENVDSNFWDFTSIDRYNILLFYIDRFLTEFYDRNLIDNNNNVNYYFTSFYEKEITNRQRISVLLLSNRLRNFDYPFEYSDCNSLVCFILFINFICLFHLNLFILIIMIQMTEINIMKINFCKLYFIN